MNTRNLLFAATLTTLGGCAVLSQLLDLAGLDVLGVTPSASFSDAGSVEYGVARIALGSVGRGGKPLAPPLDLLEFEAEDGSAIEVADLEEKPGHDRGSFLMLVDGSGSVEVATGWDCDGCPTDPSRIRVEAVKTLASELEACSGDWQMSLLEFGGDNPSQGLHINRMIAPWTTSGSKLGEAANQLSSWYGTPLWDGISEALDLLDDQHVKEFGLDEDRKPDSREDPKDDGTRAGRGFVVISDGADTESVAHLDKVVSKANALGIPVHAIGFGPASDVDDSVDPYAVDDLRAVAEQTGGVYGYVSHVDELPHLTEAIARAMCGGYSEFTVTFAEPPTSGSLVRGLVRVKDTRIEAPFMFRAP